MAEKKIFHTDVRVTNRDVDTIKQLDDDELMKAISAYSEQVRDVCRAELERRLVNTLLGVRTGLGKLYLQIMAMGQAIDKHTDTMIEFNKRSAALTRIVIGIMFLSLIISIKDPLGELLYSLFLKFFGI